MLSDACSDFLTLCEEGKEEDYKAYTEKLKKEVFYYAGERYPIRYEADLLQYVNDAMDGFLNGLIQFTHLKMQLNAVIFYLDSFTSGSWADYSSTLDS